MSIKAGDWVRLRAGGPLMEVIELADGGARCEWFLGTERQVAWVCFEVMVNVRREQTLKSANPVHVLN